MFDQGVSAKFFDGQSARAHTVKVRVVDHQNGGALLIEQDGHAPRHWPVQHLRELRHQARDEGIVLRLDGSDPARLIIPHGPAEDIIRKISPDLNQRHIPKSMQRKLLIWTGGAIASVSLILLVLLPALSGQLAKMIPLSREVAMGRSAIEQIDKYLSKSANSLTCRNQAGDLALAKMITRLSSRANLPYQLNVRIFDYDQENAFAVPGGYIVLFSGLIKAADSAEEVAGVLAHEIGHVVHRDSTRRTLRTAGSAGIIGMIFGDFAGGFAVLAVTKQLINARYSQGAESSADDFAHELLAKAGLPSAPMGNFFDKLKKKYGGKTGLMSHLASHPELGKRAEKARNASVVSATGFQPILSTAEWRDLQNICQ
jgi:Zn-dependent protease with chaperone function